MKKRDKFHYLKYGLAVVLGFVGVKMLMPLLGAVYSHVAGQPDPHWHVDKFVSLGVIVCALGVSMMASLMFPNKETAQSPLKNAKAAARLES